MEPPQMKVQLAPKNQFTTPTRPKMKKAPLADFKNKEEIHKKIEI